jgi:hypothetical protein
MYREPHDALVETIARLQRELHDIGTVRRPFPKRLLWGVTFASALIAILSSMALVASRTHTRELEQSLAGARARLDTKTQALSQCESFASESVNAQRQYAVAIDRLRTWGCCEP